MWITDAFREEHRTLLTQIDQLRRWSEGSPGDWTGVQGLTASLTSHAHLEEELLFWHLEPLLGRDGPLEVMRQEHREIEALLACLGEARDQADARATAVTLVQLAVEHFAKEENVLFPMAEQVLGADVLAELGDRCVKARTDVAGKHRW